MALQPIAFSGAFFDGNADPIAGATVTITIRNAAGTAVITNAACTERTGETGSWYEYILTPASATTYTGVMFCTAVAAVQSWLLVGSETAVDDSAGLTASDVWSFTTRTLTSPTLTFQAPFWPDAETLTIVRGDSYTGGVDNRPLQWTSSAFPVLTGASIVLLMRSANAPNDVQSFSGTVINATTAEVELTSTQTGALDVSSNRNAPAYDYALVATLSDLTVVTLVMGNVIVRKTPVNL